MRKPVLVLMVLFCILVLVTILRAVIENSLSTNSIRLTEITSEIKRLERENTLLRETIVQASSYINIKQEATKRGFIDLSSYIVVSGSSPIARKP